MRLFLSDTNDLKSLDTDLKAEIKYAMSDYKSAVNQSGLRRITSADFHYGLSLATSFDGAFNFSLGSSWQTQRISANRAYSYTTTTSFVNAFLHLNKHWASDLSLNYHHYGRLEKNPDYYFLDFGMSYDIPHTKLSLGLNGKNLLNTDTFKTYSISDIGTTITSYRLLPRMILLSASYQF